MESCFVLYLTKIFLSKICILNCLVLLNSVPFKPCLFRFIVRWVERIRNIKHDVVVQELKSGGKYEFQKDNLKRRLIIKNCSVKDDGKYTCRLLEQTTTAELYVSRKIAFTVLIVISCPETIDRLCRSLVS